MYKLFEARQRMERKQTRTTSLQIKDHRSVLTRPEKWNFN